MPENEDLKHWSNPGISSRFEILVEAFGVKFHVESMTESGRILKYKWGEIMDILESFGQLPLPPYIAYSKEKEKDYQTVFAKNRGSVAAPTASLHFTEKLLEELTSVKNSISPCMSGSEPFLGFKPKILETTRSMKNLHLWTVRYLKESRVNTSMEKNASLSEQRSVGHWSHFPIFGRKFLSMSAWGVFSGSSKLLGCSRNHLKRRWLDTEWNDSTKWYHRFLNFYLYHTRIQISDSRWTHYQLSIFLNLHLLVLISSFLGYTQTMDIYKHAIAHGYRFYSFWDGMYIHTK
jgi:S-adenosylmethionine:tRNA ribosyltransferase-isomerase